MSRAGFVFRLLIYSVSVWILINTLLQPGVNATT
jgi:hypothetical protein